MGSQIKFTVYARPEPQGSVRGFVMSGRAIITSNNKKLKPYRQELTHTAMNALAGDGTKAPMAEKHVPVSMVIDFHLERPKSIPKKRTHIVVKPDMDKLIRSTLDALTGIMYRDDAQVVELSVRKHYGVPERAEIAVTILEADYLF